MTDHNPLPRCPYCGAKATLIEGYWPTSNEYRARWVCTKEDAASRLVRAKHRKDAVDKALKTANQKSSWAPYSAARSKWQKQTAQTEEGAAILAGRLQPRLILSGKGARIEDADDRDMLRMLEALAEAMEARGWCTDAIWADVHRIAWWMNQRSDALVEATTWETNP